MGGNRSSLIGERDVYSTYEAASWPTLGSTVDEVGSTAYGRGAVHATAEIPLMSPAAPGGTRLPAAQKETHPS